MNWKHCERTELSCMTGLRFGVSGKTNPSSLSLKSAAAQLVSWRWLLWLKCKIWVGGECGEVGFFVEDLCSVVTGYFDFTGYFPWDAQKVKYMFQWILSKYIFYLNPRQNKIKWRRASLSPLRTNTNDWQSSEKGKKRKALTLSHPCHYEKLLAAKKMCLAKYIYTHTSSHLALSAI